MTDKKEFVPPPFDEPKTLDEAVARRDQRKSEIVAIQNQLADRNRNIDGRRMSDVEYWTWHKAASAAWRFKIDELRLLKAWIVRENERRLEDRRAKREEEKKKRRDGATNRTVDDAFGALRDMADLARYFESENRRLQEENASLQAEIESLRENLFK